MISAQLAWLSAIGVLMAAGCGQDLPAGGPAPYTGRISGDWTGDPALRVAYGRHWAIGGDTEVGANGTFRVPASSSVVVGYLDVNGNGRLDRFAEPSGDCRLTGREWRCSIELRRTTLHRSISRRASEHHDKTYVFWEDFAVNGSRVAGSQLCVEHRCTGVEAPPFLSPSDEKVQMFSICGEQGFSPVDAEVRGLSQALRVPLARPADLVAEMRVEAAPMSQRADSAPADLRLQIAAPAVDRVLVWAGHVDPRSREALRVYWTSEDGRFEITEAPGGVTARLPTADVEQCRRDPDCEIVVQLLAYGSPPGAPVVSSTEFRSTVAFRGVP